MLHKIESALFRLGLISDSYIMRRNILEGIDMNYDAVRKHWDDDKIKVHRDTSDAVIETYASHIANMMNVTRDDILLTVGCGDGHVDSYLQDKVHSLYGFDFAASKIEAAKKKNPRGNYFVSSFLEDYQCAIGGGKVNKIYSSGVAQYCKPEDLHWFIEIQANILRKNGGGIIGHFDVPDRVKADKYYSSFSSTTVKKYQDKLRQIFDDGSYWHDMENFLTIGKRLGIEVQITDSPCNYRSDIIFRVK